MTKTRSKAKQKLIDDKVGRAKQLKLSKKQPLMNIAAFDQATKCGVAYQASNTDEFKVELWDLKIGSKESQGMKWIRFEARLLKFIQQNNIEIIAYELPSGRNINPIIHSSKLIAIIEKVCVENEVEYIEFAASEIKKFATSKGNANKEVMIEYAKSLWGYQGEDDNEADAIHILHLLKSKINV
jgi:Holliday junction resolvasome RuvABC endonuclease subunit